MNDITRLTATEMAAKLRARDLSAQDVLAAHRRRVEAREPEVNAFITLDWDAAEERAVELDALAAAGGSAGALHGLPIGIKDLFETTGLRTTRGSVCFEDHTPGVDALHVARLRDAGAIIIGKTNTPEFGFSGQTSNLVSGVTRNPHDLGKTVGGSSGGAAAALAAEMAPLADGSDLGGSLRAPAAWCGVVGFRPTSGLIPKHPNRSSFDGLSVPGPMARNMTDLMLMQSVMQGNTPREPIGFWGETPEAAMLDRPLEAGRAALSLAPFGAAVQPSIAAAIAPVAQLCEQLGWSVTDAAPDLAPLLAHSDVFRGLSALGAKAYYKPDMAEVNDNFRFAVGQAEDLRLEAYVAYQATRQKAWDAVVAFFETYDFALWPTTTGLAFSADLKDHELPEDWRTVTLTPVLELPSLSLPFGFSEDGLPVGLHICGPRGSDARLLRFARMIEQALG